MLQILGRANSINVRKVLWTCAELGLAATLQPWGAGLRSTQDAQFLALNPNGLVPVLLDGDFVLWESNTICRYLATREQRLDLLPGEPRDRARVEQWMDWQVAELNPAWRDAFMARVRGATLDESLVQRSVAAWNRHMGILERELQAGSAWVAGSSFTLADVVLGLSTHRWMLTPIERPVLPAVQAYYERWRLRAPYREHGAAQVP